MVAGTDMQKISTDDIDPSTSGNDINRRKLADPLNTTDVAINRYAIKPGERLAGLHTHMDQEEVFIITEGEATFETMDGEVIVGTDEVIRFGPGEFQAGKNDSGNEIVIYALGAPRNTEDMRIPIGCSKCDQDNMRLSVAEGEEILVCPDCSAESEPECPECGHDNMSVRLAEDSETPIEVCLNCGAESEAR
jgi:uncharacterized cupin superfamily protein